MFGRKRDPELEPEPLKPEATGEGEGKATTSIRRDPWNMESGLMGAWNRVFDKVLEYGYKGQSDSEASYWDEVMADMLGERAVNLIGPHFPEDAKLLRRKIGLINRRYSGLDRLKKIDGAWTFTISKLFFGRRAQVWSDDDGSELDNILGTAGSSSGPSESES